METISLILSGLTLTIMVAFLPMLLTQLKISREYAAMFEPEKIKAYIALMEQKHESELTLSQKTHLANLRKIQQFKEKLQQDYTNLLIETAEYLRNIDVPDKAQFIREHFGSHADFFIQVVIPRN